MTSSTDWEETTGNWWIPGYEDQSCRGVLSFVPDRGAHLSIVDSEIFPAQSPGPGEYGQYPVINGVTAEGKWVTLLDSFDLQGKWRSPGWNEKTIFSNIILDGCHITRKDDIRFYSGNISFANLHRWMGLSGFKFSRPKRRNRKNYFQFRVDYRVPPSVKFKMDDKIKGEIWSSVNYSPGLSLDGEFSFKQGEALKIRWQQAQNIDDVIGFFRDISVLLSFVVQEDCPIAFCNLKTRYVSRVPRRKSPIIRVYFYQKEFKEPKSGSFQRWLFSFEDIMHDPGIFFQSWSTVRQKITDLIYLYREATHVTKQPVETEFLFLCQAVESYHQRFVGGQYVPKREAARIRKILEAAIPDGLDSELEKALRSRLRFLNEYSLRTRIEGLVERNKDALNILCPEFRPNIARLIRLRNQITHRSNFRELKEKDFEDIRYFSQALGCIFELSVLGELGFDQGAIMKLVTHSPAFRDRRANLSLLENSNTR